LVTIVNDRDEVLRHVPPAERQAGDIYRVSALWLTNTSGQILLAQRHPEMNNGGGLWGPAAAGTVEKAETYGGNVTKEAAEELGLRQLNFQLGPKVLSAELPNGRRYFCHWFFATVNPATQFVLEADEVAAVRWVAPAALRTELMNHSDRFIPSAQRWIELFL
jgi:isopentenyldiphosphate isomerase